MKKKKGEEEERKGVNKYVGYNWNDHLANKHNIDIAHFIVFHFFVLCKYMS
jgi:hypothetical protein